MYKLTILSDGIPPGVTVFKYAMFVQDCFEYAMLLYRSDLYVVGVITSLYNKHLSLLS